MAWLYIVPIVLSATCAWPLAAQAAPAAESKVAAPPDALALARKPAKEDYVGWSYGAGESAKTKTIDCTCFLAAVCRELAKESGKSLDEQTLRGIKVVLSDEDKQNLQALVEKSDPKTSGVVQALVDAKLGVRIEAKDARAGDLVQYWYREGDQWAGHASIIESVSKGKAVMFGSHKTTLKARADDDAKIATAKGGIGTGPTVDLAAKKGRAFVVRWTSPKAVAPTKG